MRPILTFLFLYIGLFSRSAGAQTVKLNEYYHVGDVIRMAGVDPAGLAAGPAGTGVTWDFSAAHTTGTMSTTSILHDTSSVFITSNLLYLLPDGKRMHVRENSTDTYINGIYDPATNITLYYNTYNIAKRPFAYNSSYVDTYHVDNDLISLTGKGLLIATGDGYGTLKLPNGTFTNVLRIRKQISENDTTGGTVISGKTMTSYLWFDTSHNAPLFQIDSASSVTGITQDAMMLASTEAVPVMTKQSTTNAWFSNSGLVLVSNFERGATYQMELYNIIGARLLSIEFAPTGGAVEFVINQQLNPGIYIVAVTPKTNRAEREILKVVKQ